MARVDWNSEQVKIALAKVKKTLDKLRNSNIKGVGGITVYKQHAIESVFSKYTGVYMSYKTIIMHLRKAKEERLI